MFGKTPSKGTQTDSKEENTNSGLIFRLISQVFKDLSAIFQDNRNGIGSLSFSMFQIYNEKVYDLLQVASRLKEEVGNSIRC